MAIVNKFAVPCCGCGKPVNVGEGLSEKRSTLGLPGDGWLTKHNLCAFQVPKPQGRGQWRRDLSPEQVCTYDDPWDPGNPNYGGLYHGMTESEFFGGDVGDKG